MGNTAREMETKNFKPAKLQSLKWGYFRQSPTAGEGRHEEEPGRGCGVMGCVRSGEHKEGRLEQLSTE